MSHWDYTKELEDIEIDGHVIALEFRRYGYETPAYISGPPEFCYPAEGEDEFDLIGMGVYDQDGNQLYKTESEKDKLWHRILETLTDEQKEE